MNDCLVTVILPIYNVDAYLDRCIQSVVYQTYTNLEIILVDDGSTDRCAAICDAWCEKDARIRVIHKKNAGLGMARNTGIDNASGKYILFVDSDDYIELNTVEMCVCAAEKESADLVSFGLKQIGENGTILNDVVPCPVKSSYEGEDVQEKLLPDVIGTDPETGKTINVWLSACVHLFRTSVITDNHWYFVSEREIISEDTYSLLRLFKILNKVVILGKSFYCYCQNNTSLTHTFRPDRIDQINRLYVECIRVCDEMGYNDSVKKRLEQPYLSNLIAALKMIYSEPMSTASRKKYLSEALNDQMMHSILDTLDLRQETINRRILIKTIRYRMYWLSRFLISLKT